MSYAHTSTSKCVTCVTTPAAIAARAHLREYTIHASAQRRPVVVDLQARATSLRRLTANHTWLSDYDGAAALLRDLSPAELDQVLRETKLDPAARIGIKHYLESLR